MAPHLARDEGRCDEQRNQQTGNRWSGDGLDVSRHARIRERLDVLFIANDLGDPGFEGWREESRYRVDGEISA